MRSRRTTTQECSEVEDGSLEGTHRLKATRLVFTLLLLGSAACSMPDKTFVEGFPEGGTGEATADQGGPVGPLENCGNGLDDDGDQLIDCADATCQCLPLPPEGWTGFYELRVAEEGGAAGCGGQYQELPAFIGHTALKAQPATCGTCECAGPETLQCATTVKVWSYVHCTGDSRIVPEVTQGVCKPLATAGFGSIRSFSAEVIAPLPNVSCEVQGGAPSVPSASWNDTATACLAKQSSAGSQGCVAGSVCAPKSGQPGFLAGMCIQHKGLEACPAGAFVDKHVLYSDFVDTRGCSPCACSAADLQCPEGIVHKYADDAGQTCTLNPLGETFGAPSCLTEDVGVVNVSFLLELKGSPSGTCKVSTGAGQPQGDAVPDTNTAVTFCCIPS